MRKRWFLVGVSVLLFSCLLAGCGVKQELHDAVVADLSEAQQELQSIKAELASVQAELETTGDELTARNAELESAESEIASLETEKNSLISEKEALQASYDELNGENSAVMQELADIKEVYPARYFSSKKELQDWLYANDVSDRPASTIAEPLYEKALDIQEAALKDGFIISSYIDYYSDTGEYMIILEAVAGGDVYVFNPETDDLLNLSELSDLMKVGQ